MKVPELSEEDMKRVDELLKKKEFLEAARLVHMSARCGWAEAAAVVDERARAAGL